MPIGLSTPEAKEQGAEKLAQLEAHLESVSGPNSPDLQRVQTLCHQLYHRAPRDFVERSTIETLAEIGSEAHEFYNSHLESDRPFSVAVKNYSDDNARSSYTTIFTAVGDRPFIIDSLSELIRARKYRHHVLLHPIVKHEDGRLISLVYVELDRIDGSELAELQSQIEAWLADLVLVTDDFSSMLVRIETAARIIETGINNPQVAEEDRVELAQHLRWLADGGFVLLGYREWKVESAPPQRLHEPKLHVEESENLGLFRSANNNISDALKDADRDAQYLSSIDRIVHHEKVLLESPVHRRARMDLVVVKIPDSGGKTQKISAFLGLLTSKANIQEAFSIPLIRKKLKRVLEREGLLPNTHDYKEVCSIADSLPKSDLFQHDVETLRRDIGLITDIQRRDEVRVSFRLHPLRRLISVIVVMPKERLSSDLRRQVQEYAENTFSAPPRSAEYRLTITEEALAVIHLLIPNPTYAEVQLDIAEFEEKISELTLRWEDAVESILLEKLEPEQARKTLSFYSDAFPEEYKATASPEIAVRDILVLESLSEQNSLAIAISAALHEDDAGIYHLRLYKRGELLTLSAILPYLENTGLNILNEQVTSLSSTASVWGAIYTLRVRTATEGELDLKQARQTLLPGLRQILLGEAENDKLNALLLEPGLNCREIAVLRALTNYLWQINQATSLTAARIALVENPAVAKTIVDYFYTKFDPDFNGEQPARLDRLEQLEGDFQEALKLVPKLTQDRILRALLNVIDATVRTNFFIREEGFGVALKIRCTRIAKMPQPRPFFEVFINTPHFEGVHHRGGRVARGGIRWSERREDYRTEVLGLVKTQMIKNALIIPVGAKGGFALKQIPREHAALGDAVKSAYQGFIRGLLEITDNRIGGEIIHPERVVIYDEPDPYLVVAADKGTATFSDVANEIAINEFKFWLGDAFASGGSIGYDHKKLGITARGAWECVKRHFREIGLDVDTEEFSVVGIGDMSGDVFGNGLLRSRKAKLIAAFNHRHIFIDPNPDPESSFQERERIFAMQRSQWTDYDEKTLSQGGAIYERSQKEIRLSPEARDALGATEEVVSGVELVKIILRAPADLLWNGGIGTYVKSFDEENIHVGDPSNDEVRVDARELRTKVVGEGGNLGFTQLARIEYSKIGGHINTDAVDNSGGVDLSDLEVNLKILLSEPVKRGELSAEERNELFMSYADQSCEKVESHNRAHGRTLSLAVRRSRRHLDNYRALIAALEQEGRLDRSEEFLPDDETFEKRLQLKAGLSRPVLAVIVAYAKMSLFDTIIDSKLTETKLLQEKFLYNYFPRGITERFRDDITHHPLKAEIIATQAANFVVERMGATFVHRTAEETGATKSDIILALLAADSIIDTGKLTLDMRVMDRANTTRAFLNSLLSVTEAIDSMTRWIIEHREEYSSFEQLVDKYKPTFDLFVSETETFINRFEEARFRETLSSMIGGGFPERLARRIAALSYASSYLDVVNIASELKCEVLDVARLYASLSLDLHIRQVLDQASQIEPNDHWDGVALQMIRADLRNCIGELSRCIISSKGAASLEAMNEYFSERSEGLERYKQSIATLSNQNISTAALLVISHQLASLARSVD